MKKLVYSAAMVLCTSIVSAQNVGIGETSPAAKLTIKSSDAFNKTLLIKTNADDTAMYLLDKSLFINGFSPTAASLTVNNKYFLPLDNPQLSIMAYGERAGINSNGSSSILEFDNANTSKKFVISGYAGNVASNELSISYVNGTYKPLLFFSETGATAVGSYAPTGRLQVNHRSSSSSPTLVLMDSSNSNASILQFKNLSGADSWSLRAYLDQAGTADYLDVVIGGTIVGTFGNGTNFGLGVPGPTEKLDVSGNVKLTGELVRPSTGTSNLVPIAYGNVAGNAGINSGSGNFTVSKISTGWYGITITGETYQFQTYTTTVTPVTGPAITATGSGGGILYVYTYNAAGVATDNQFCFVVHKQ